MTGLIFSPFSSPLSTEHLIFFCLTESYNKSCNTPVGCNGPAFTCNKETLFCECADNFVFSNGSCCSLSQFGSSCRSNDDCAEELHVIDMYTCVPGCTFVRTHICVSLSSQMSVHGSVHVRIYVRERQKEKETARLFYV